MGSCENGATAFLQALENMNYVNRKAVSFASFLE